MKEAPFPLPFLPMHTPCTHIAQMNIEMQAGDSKKKREERKGKEKRPPPQPHTTASQKYKLMRAVPYVLLLDAVCFPFH